MMIAAWTLLDGADLKSLNPPKALLVSAANTVAVLCFIIAGAVRWREALIVGAGALLGGFAGAWAGQKLPSAFIRTATIAIAVGMTIYFFLGAY